MRLYEIEDKKDKERFLSKLKNVCWACKKPYTSINRETGEGQRRLGGCFYCSPVRMPKKGGW